MSMNKKRKMKQNMLMKQNMFNFISSAINTYNRREKKRVILLDEASMQVVREFQDHGQWYIVLAVQELRRLL